MQLIFDTGSSWLWLPTKECGNDCPKKSSLFDNNESLSYLKVSSAPTLVAYGGGSVWGYKSQDQICLEKSMTQTCMNNYNFLSVFATKDLEGL